MDKSLFTITKFTGGRGDNFLEDIVSLGNLRGYNRNAERRIDLLRMHLGGPALTWFRSLAANQRATWADLMETFNGKYCAEPTPEEAMFLQDSFAQLTLGGSDIETFGALVLEKGGEIEKSEEEMAARLVNGLPEKLQFFVRARNPQTLDEALNAAKVGEAHGYRESTTPSTRASSQHITHDVSEMATLA